MPLPIRTRHLLIRRFAHQDEQDILDFVSHHSVTRAVPEIEVSQRGVQKYIETQIGYQPFELDKCFDLAIERSADSKVIGLLTLIRRKHEQGELGYAVGVEYRGHGYATEAAGALIEYAFHTLELHRIQATTSSDNPASYSVMERLGMRREGCMREAEFKDGRWHDVLVYSILAEEWQPLITRK